MRLAYESLTLDDLGAHKCWKMDHSDETVSPIDDVRGFDQDEPYVSYAEYQFSNGDIFSGYMCVYDCTGNRVFIDGVNTSLCMYCEASKEEVAALCKITGLDASAIFPIKYQTYIKCFGSDSGNIGVET